MIAALLSALVLVVEPGSEPGPDARSAPLDQVFPFWTDYNTLAEDERDAFELAYRLNAPLRGDGTEFSFWVESGGGEYVLLDASGPVTPPDLDSFERGYQLFTDAPQGAVQVQMTLTLPAPTKSEYTFDELEASIAQAANAVRSSMGIRSLFMPRLDTIRFIFDGPAPDADFIDEAGVARPIEAVFGNEVLVTPGRRSNREAVTVRFGNAPVTAVLETRN